MLGIWVMKPDATEALIKSLIMNININYIGHGFCFNSPREIIMSK